MNFIIRRLQEPSTYAGIAAFLTGFGVLGLTEHEWNQVFGALAALAGAVAIFMREGERNSGSPVACAHPRDYLNGAGKPEIVTGVPEN